MELCPGVSNGVSKNRFLAIMETRRGQDAQGVILGRTEIALLVQQADTDIPLYDTTAIHAGQAVEYALGVV